MTTIPEIVTEPVSLQALPDDLPEVDRMKAVRQNAKAAAQYREQFGIVEGECLYEIKSNKYWQKWGFDSLKDYINRELGFQYSRGYSLIAVYEKYVLELKLPMSRLRDLEWSKARAVVPIITPENKDQILEAIQKLSFSDVRKMVRELKGGGGTTFSNRTFRLTDGQADTVNEALEEASAITGSDKTGHLLEVICAGFLAERYAGADDVGKLASRVGMLLGKIESAFGIKLDVTKLDREITPLWAEHEIVDDEKDEE